MKKRVITAMCLTMALAMAIPMTCFGGTGTAAATKTTATAAGTAAASQAAISLSVDDAFVALKGSPQMELIDMQYTSDKGAESGYAENVASLKKMEEYMDMLSMVSTSSAMSMSDLSGVDFSSKNVLAAMRDFAREVTEPNKIARMDALNLNFVKMYYQVKNVEEMTKIAAESVNIKQSIYDQTALKYKLGTASKMELLTAESELAGAKDSLTEAQNGLAQAKMGFNLYLGYDLTRTVTLTSEITEVAKPTITLDEAIAKAKENRLSIRSAAYTLKLAEISAGNYKAYPSTSSTYLKAKATLLGATTANNLAVPTVEMDVRTKYDAMNLAYQKVQTGKLTVSNSKETLRLCKLQYEHGLCTLTTLNQASLGYTAALNTQASALLDYNIAVREFDLSYGYGVEAASI